jgi:hypothetical protein
MLKPIANGEELRFFASEVERLSGGKLRAKAWRRLSASPTRRYFSKRCPPPAQALPG